MHIVAQNEILHCNDSAIPEMSWLYSQKHFDSYDASSSKPCLAARVFLQSGLSDETILLKMQTRENRTCRQQEAIFESLPKKIYSPSAFIPLRLVRAIQLPQSERVIRNYPKRSMILKFKLQIITTFSKSQILDIQVHKARNTRTISHGSEASKKPPIIDRFAIL